jgi:hypothetical protein
VVKNEKKFVALLDTNPVFEVLDYEFINGISVSTFIICRAIGPTQYSLKFTMAMLIISPV